MRRDRPRRRTRDVPFGEASAPTPVRPGRTGNRGWCGVRSGGALARGPASPPGAAVGLRGLRPLAGQRPCPGRRPRTRRTGPWVPRSGAMERRRRDAGPAGRHHRVERPASHYARTPVFGGNRRELERGNPGHAHPGTLELRIDPCQCAGGRQQGDGPVRSNGRHGPTSARASGARAPPAPAARDPATGRCPPRGPRVRSGGPAGGSTRRE